MAEITTETAGERIERVAAELGLTMTVEFVPWSRSRNAGEKQPSLNWKVTIHRWTPANHIAPRPAILTTDYMAGCGHCPSYKASAKALGHSGSVMRDEAIRRECETGKVIRRFAEDSSIGIDRFGAELKPELADVLHSLASDAEAMDYGTFEEWAEELGFETDSRKAEATYRACLEIGLKLRNALGDDGFAKLREAVRDY